MLYVIMFFSVRKYFYLSQEAVFSLLVAYKNMSFGKQCS